MVDCLRSFSLVKSRGLVHLVTLGLILMMLCHVTFKKFDLKYQYGL